jgi:hypothetical protein
MALLITIPALTSPLCVLPFELVKLKKDDTQEPVDHFFHPTYSGKNQGFLPICHIDCSLGVALTSDKKIHTRGLVWQP